MQKFCDMSLDFHLVVSGLHLVDVVVSEYWH